ncbi:MAG: haloacid dehalogenase-like hydrolase [Candidatus Kapabacteria bacterium]|nr:haloacid dehalogenase-like hydrolase [Candidatus Kapabacteria bacterium]
MIESKQLYIDKILEKLPYEIASTIVSLIKDTTFDEANPPLAVFDMDWTLLDGDICESLYLHFLSQGKDLPLSWKKYNEMLRAGDHLNAYSEIIIAMAGITLDSIYSTCDYLLNHPDYDIEYNIEGETFKFKAPKVNQNMYALATVLKLAGFKVAVVSASAHYSVRYIANNYLGINPDNAFGIKSHLIVDDNYIEYLDSQLIPPITWNHGKVELLKAMYPNSKIVLTCGDSFGDIPMMKMTDSLGLVIIKKGPESNWQMIHDELTDSIRKIVV